MTQDEFDLLHDLELCNTVSAQDLVNQEPRTLLYGRNSDETAQHVYIKNGVLHLLVIRGSHFRVVTHKTGLLNIKEIVPDVKIHPERCDYEFCKLLRLRGVTLPFARFDERERYLNGRKYAGLVLREKPELVAE